VGFKPENVIDETLEHSIKRLYPEDEEISSSILTGLPPESEQTLEAFIAHPLSAWMEMNFGLAEEEGHWSDFTPFSGSRNCQPSEQTKFQSKPAVQPSSRCSSGSKTKGPCLHQFISQGAVSTPQLSRRSRGL